MADAAGAVPKMGVPDVGVAPNSEAPVPAALAAAAAGAASPAAAVLLAAAKLKLGAAVVVNEKMLLLIGVALAAPNENPAPLLAPTAGRGRAKQQ